MLCITWVLSTKVQVHLFVFSLVLWCRNRVWPAASKRWSTFYKNRSDERVLAVLFKILQVAHISDVSKPNRTVHIYRGRVGFRAGRSVGFRAGHPLGHNRSWHAQSGKPSGMSGASLGRSVGFRAGHSLGHNRSWRAQSGKPSGMSGASLNRWEMAGGCCAGIWTSKVIQTSQAKGRGARTL